MFQKLNFYVINVSGPPTNTSVTEGYGKFLKIRKYKIYWKYLFQTPYNIIHIGEPVKSEKKSECK